MGKKVDALLLAVACLGLGTALTATLQLLLI